MNYDATWYGGRHRPRRLCVRWGPSPVCKKGWSPRNFWPVCCGQTAGWIKMALGMEVGLGPGHNVLDGDLAPSPKNGTKTPNFGPCLLCVYQDTTWYRGRPQPRRHCVRCGPSSPSPKGAQQPNFWPMSIVAKRLDGLRCHLMEVGLSPVNFVFDGDPAAPRQKKSAQPHPILAHVYCGHTAEWIKMPLGTEVNLGQGNVVLCGVTAPP